MQKKQCPSAHKHGILHKISRALKPTSKQSGRGMTVFEVVVGLESLARGEAGARFFLPRKILRRGSSGQEEATAPNPVPTLWLQAGEGQPGNRSANQFNQGLVSTQGVQRKLGCTPSYPACQWKQQPLTLSWLCPGQHPGGGPYCRGV